MSVDDKVKVFQVHKIGCLRKTPFCKPGHIYSLEMFIGIANGGQGGVEPLYNFWLQKDQNILIEQSFSSHCVSLQNQSQKVKFSKFSCKGLPPDPLVLQIDCALVYSN